ncbi:dienelactone hydrolase family protein [Botrimarina sp.]|uniref:dienelactone hydrolase family protein n=1 Tax=Botrimarina sp. TaxID=2795802 RepID=UPI0032EF7C0A
MSRQWIVSLLLLPLTLASATGQPTPEERLENTPRHLEWAEVQRDGRTIECFVAYPERADDAPAVVVIHEIFGLTDWVRGVTDQLAEKGYLAIAPDLLSGMGPGGGGTSSFDSGDAVRRAIRNLANDQVNADLDAAARYVTGLPSADGSVSVAGFCWGGSRSFAYATHNPKLTAACVFYGTAPTDADAISQIACPVFGFYGENDNRVNSTIDQTKRLMEAAGKAYKPVIYDGAGHGFMRAGEAADASDANKQARRQAWDRWLEILQEK